jgi:arylsulfatase A-like enzyme
MKPLLSLIAFLLASTAFAQKPNIVVFLADDQGWGDLSIHGNTNLKTPHIDSLGKDGARFTQFFVQPVCSPTRAEFLTGRYHLRGGVVGVTTGGERLNLDEKTIADSLKAGGYATGCFGKWHNGTQYPYHPLGRGFAEYYGFTSGHWGDYFSAPLDHNGKLVTGTGFLTDDLTDHAFFAFITFNTPHSPMQVPEPYWNRFKDFDLKMKHNGPMKEDLGHTRAALAMCENIDDNVGRVLKKLEELKLAENTIVLYFSDNGPNGWRWNNNMKGRKGTTDDGGVKSPLLMRWPGKIAAGTVVDEVAGAIDLMPTLLDFAKVPKVGEKPLDGMSLRAAISGESKESRNRTLFQHWNGRVSARTNLYRLDADGKLFDMRADPQQKTDIAKQEQKLTEKLAKDVAAWKQDVGVGKKSDRPYTVGYPEMPLTQLPARDGVGKGNVKRSASAPNCSFFTNWTSVEDRITWDVEVHTPGNYSAEILYTCSQEQIGSTVELTLGGAKWIAKVTEAHDPVLRGMENDRVPRVGESYVKEFKSLKLESVKVAAGRGTLTLRATDIPGKHVMDVRGVLFTLNK